MAGSSVLVRGAAMLIGAVVTAASVVGCAGESRGRPVMGGSYVGATGPASLRPSAVTEAEPAFADNSGGTLEPAPPNTTFLLTADQVQEKLAGDGATALWVASSPTLLVRSGSYHPLSAASSGALSPSATGTPSYVFSGNTGPCPPGRAGGAGGSTAAASTPTICTGTVVASAESGDIEDVEVGPA